MKKLIPIIAFIILFIFLFSSCTVINTRYTGKRIITEREAYEEYDDYYLPSDYYYSYGPYYNPFMWTGLNMWNPFWYYGMFGYSYGMYNYLYYNLPYYGSYGGIRYGSSVISKRQLKRGSKKSLRGISRRSGSQGRIKATRSGTISSRTGSSRGRISSSGRVSRSRIKKKN